MKCFLEKKKKKINKPCRDEMITLGRAKKTLDVNNQRRRRNEPGFVGWVSADKVSRRRRQFIRLRRA